MPNKPIHHTVEQNTPEWYALRAGVPTASCFEKILTPTTMQLSRSADKYIFDLIAESVSIPEERWQSDAMKRGHELEDEAARMFGLLYDSEPVEAGFWTLNGYGASPDRLIGEDGLLEIKCPNPSTHVAYLLNPDLLYAEYKCQVQGQMLVTQREKSYLISYAPKFPLVVIDVAKDELFHSKLEPALDQFVLRLAELRNKVLNHDSTVHA